jgi:subtilisin family serine protease
MNQPRPASRWVARLIGALGVAACATVDPVPVAPGGRTGANVDSAKVDAAVLAAMAAGDSVSVIVLGQTQLLQRPSGLEQFQASHEGWTRQALRSDVIGRLRAIASAEQAVMIATLGASRRVRLLWLYNAIAGTLAPSEIAALSRLGVVARVYANPNERVVFARGNERVSLVVPATAPPRFDPDRVPIAWNVRWLGVDRVWRELGAVGEGVVIASIDDGVNYAHADLGSHVWSNTREVANTGRDDDGNGYVDDVHGYDFGLMTPEVRSTSTTAQHGTWTAGRRRRGARVVGRADDSRLKAREIIEATARDTPPAGKDPRTGRGLVDALAAVRVARALAR